MVDHALDSLSFILAPIFIILGFTHIFHFQQSILGASRHYIDLVFDIYNSNAMSLRFLKYRFEYITGTLFLAISSFFYSVRCSSDFGRFHAKELQARRLKSRRFSDWFNVIHREVIHCRGTIKIKLAPWNSVEVQNLVLRGVCLHNNMYYSIYSVLKHDQYDVFDLQLNGIEYLQLHSLVGYYYSLVHK